MKVAIVHFWFVNFRGGERFVEILLEIFPQADIFTHVFVPDNMPMSIKSRTIYTTYIQKLPFAKKLYQKYMPLMPNALLKFNLQDYDLVISSESGPAKGVVPNPNAFHICYCHSPMRYLWDMYHEYSDKSNPLVRFFMRLLTPRLRLWDAATSNLVDHFMANSSFVAKRIRRYYNRESTLVFPPVDLDRFISVQRKPEDFYLFFGQLIGYKRADLAIEACIASGRKLIVAGDGAGGDEHERYKKTGLIDFKGKVSDGEVRELFSAARALIFPGIEDFGCIPVEAQAAGCPVIAIRAGGAVDSVIENVTGLFFDEQTPASLIEALDRFEEKEGAFSDRVQYANHVRQFSKEAFKEKILAIIAEKKRL